MKNPRIAALALALALTFLMPNAYAQTPNVQFIKWSDQTLYNTVTLTHDIYKGIFFIDDNATYGIRNTSTNNQTVWIYINSINDTAKIENATFRVFTQNGATFKNSTSWKTGDSLPAPKQSFTALPTTSYLMEFWIKGTSDATGTINLKLNIEALDVELSETEAAKEEAAAGPGTPFIGLPNFQAILQQIWEGLQTVWNYPHMRVIIALAFIAVVGGLVVKWDKAKAKRKK